jgi:acyl carrier protein
VSLTVADEINDKVSAIVCNQLDVEKEKVKPEASFINDLGADSLDIVELVMELEEAFNMSIPDEDAEKIRTVGEAIEYIRKNKGEEKN